MFHYLYSDTQSNNFASQPPTLHLTVMRIQEYNEAATQSPYLHMSELVSDGEGRTEPVVLHDGAAVVVAHGGQLGQAEGVAVLVVQEGITADILP